MVIDRESWFKDYSSFLFIFFVTTVTGLLNISLPLGIYEDVVFTKLPYTFFSFFFLSDVEFTKYFFRLDENNMFNLK